MISVSGQFLTALRSAQVLGSEATVIPPSGDPVTVPVEDGQVTIDRTADHRRQLQVTLSNPLLYPITPSDPVNVYGSMMIIKRGVRFANGVTELVQLGVFRIEDAGREIPDGGVVVTGWDKSRQVFDERFLKPRRFNQMNWISLAQQLISEVDRAAAFDVQCSDTTTSIPKHVVEQDRWAEVQRLAQLTGSEVFATETGVWRFQDVPDPSTARSVWDVDAGPGGVLVKAANTVTREAAPNVIVATGESMDGNQDPVYGIAQDTNPNSPTNVNGAYGVVPRFYSSPHIKTQAQANRVAAAQLAEHLGVTRTVSFDSVPNPALEAGDAVTIKYPDGSSELHLADVLTIPLTPDGVMTGETRAADWSAQ